MSDDRSEDKKKLIECLNLIESQLHVIVFDQKEKFRAEFRDYFPGPSWNEILQRFELARRAIENDDLDWEYVEGVGLTNKNLVWKRDLHREAKRMGILRRFLAMANSFLGSLGGALPMLEFIKEYKDMVEASLKIVRSIE